MLFVVANLRSVTIGFSGDHELAERLFSPEEHPVVPNWHEEIPKNLTAVINELNGSDDENDAYFRQQAHIAIAIIQFAYNHDADIHQLFISEDDKTLEFVFEFDDNRQAFLFESDVKDYVETSTGFKL